MDVDLPLEEGTHVCGKGAKAFEDLVLPKHLPKEVVDMGDASHMLYVGEMGLLVFAIRGGVGSYVV